MKLPGTMLNCYVVRTCFADEPAWRDVCVRATTPTVEGFLGHCELVSDPGFEGASPEELLALLPAHMRFVFIADEFTMADEGRPLLACSRDPEEGTRFRVVVDLLWCAENNLTLYNMDWRDFVDAAAPSGVLRGFRQPR